MARVAWRPVALGTLLLAAGLALAGHGWGLVIAGGPGSEGAAALAAGVLVGLLGVLMVVVPLLVPLLYRLYGPEAFTSRGTCPVVAKCARCGAFNFRGRADCKGCGAGLAWEAPAPAAP